MNHLWNKCFWSALDRIRSSSSSHIIHHFTWIVLYTFVLTNDKFLFLYFSNCFKAIRVFVCINSGRKETLSEIKFAVKKARLFIKACTFFMCGHLSAITQKSSQSQTIQYFDIINTINLYTDFKILNVYYASIVVWYRIECVIDSYLKFSTIIV